ncbi:uncharacterized protein K452DRAFT_218834 [Aplosporella prunicola CBS 121167]|uniref:Protein phosphatase methylesterase 1 n=1 Tax=Aplosporella prunicola CBS 121167 TaxID=1176127 RepID=A0A6A6BU18_9PEZI|nr:uncharacterized protein K452DRAFT_218834 [Aplosporella prunicola CBS 121167]KAF2146873.1 hypothetical protein K452DRAFT_218834 [Aplosporella prunicola CBS 121167]
MSDLQKTFAKSKLASLPPEPPLREEEQEPDLEQQQTEDDSSSASSMSSTGTVVPTATQKPAPANTDWMRYFAQELYLEHSDGSAAGSPHTKYHVYVTPPATPKTPLIVLHHGAGSSALTWALCAREIRRMMPDVGILAVEAREHGSAVYEADGTRSTDMGLARLRGDLLAMLALTQARLGWAALPPLLLVGHSLGGAVVVDAARSGELGGAVIGYAILDVVEGSAMEVLGHMRTYLAGRPGIFRSVDAAVEWHVRSRTLRNPTSARASVPSLLVQTESGKFVWKTDLGRTEPFWSDWFTGMSSKFLSARGGKLLLLAGTDRLDKELMIGQMQGKFQLQVFPAAGHFIQEDLPDQTAQSIVEFLKRNDRSTLVLPPKVSDLLAQGKKI